MAAVRWTKEQQQVIQLRDRDILVSAAAGSGKTAVLVERILSRITDPDHPSDIDRLLVVTFTRAAAGEMRDRIRAAIEQRLEEDPENEHLQRQSVLLHNARISTIHGFCTYVIQNYVQQIDLDPGYRIGDEGELKLLQEDVIHDLLEEEYQKKEPAFLRFAEAASPGKSDRKLEDLILRVDRFAMASPDPDGWLEDCVNMCRAGNAEELERLPWMKEMLRETERVLESAEEMAGENIRICEGPGGPAPYLEALQDDAEQIRRLEDGRGYADFYEAFQNLSFARLGTVRKKDSDVDPGIQEDVKKRRDALKKLLQNLRERFFAEDAEGVLQQLQITEPYIAELARLVHSFETMYAARKRERNLVDFSDLEHYALRILLQKTGDGWKRTDAAIELSHRFDEVMIDEYQDSNVLQEFLLEAVSGTEEGRFDRFMVGDMKQSVYGFRMARPELFMEKYRTYTKEDSKHQKIDLHRNFRSRGEVLDLVNDLFRKLMVPELGGIAYDEDAALYPGAEYPDVPDADPDPFRAELLLLDRSAEELAEDRSRETRIEAEAHMAAQRIRKLRQSGSVTDRESGELRGVQYRDIVILLRSSEGWANTFVRVLQEEGIPAYATSRTGYFSAPEVETVLNYLRICDNPRQDIPYTAVLRSPICGCADTDLAALRSASRDLPMCDAAAYYAESGPNAALRDRLRGFLSTWEEIRGRAVWMPIHEWIGYLLERTGYGLYAAAMPAGAQREANLRMLVEKAAEFEKTSYHGLFQFIRYIENLKKYNVDYGEVNLFGESADTVRIMTIHKSKGLEFPIVFLCGLGGSFNKMDRNAAVVQHVSLGIGMDAIDVDTRMKRPTLLKRTIQNAIMRDEMGEELRVLYVAMTRAKEKLILCGMKENPEALCPKTDGTGHLPYTVLSGANGYLDWIQAAVTEESPIEVSIIEPSQLKRQEWKTAVEENRYLSTIVEIAQGGADRGAEKVYNKEVSDFLKEKASFTYPYAGLARMPAKLSVSEIKRAYLEEMQEEKGAELLPEEEEEPVMPRFMREESEEPPKGAARGTIYHRVLECLDYREAAGGGDLKDQLHRMVREGRFSGEEAGAVRIRDIRAFLQSGIGKRMTEAALRGSLYREQPFVLNVPAGEIRKDYPGDDTILIQGVIDAFFEENGAYVIVDYKTDRVKTPDGRDLAEKYAEQLQYYRRALSQITGKPVKETVLYSFSLGREIEIG